MFLENNMNALNYPPNILQEIPFRTGPITRKFDDIIEEQTNLMIFHFC
jgi:hypothetical protein